LRGIKVTEPARRTEPTQKVKPARIKSAPETKKSLDDSYKQIMLEEFGI